MVAVVHHSGRAIFVLLDEEAATYHGVVFSFVVKSPTFTVFDDDYFV